MQSLQVQLFCCTLLYPFRNYDLAVCKTPADAHSNKYFGLCLLENVKLKSAVNTDFQICAL